MQSTVRLIVLWALRAVALLCIAAMFLLIVWRFFLGFTPPWLDVTILVTGTCSAGILAAIPWLVDKLKLQPGGHDV